MFILIELSWLYMVGGNIAWLNGLFYGLTVAVIAIVVSAVKQIGYMGGKFYPKQFPAGTESHARTQDADLSDCLTLWWLSVLGVG